MAALERRIRVAIMNGEPDNAPPMMSRDRNSPIIDAIKKGDVPPIVGVVEDDMAAAAHDLTDTAASAEPHEPLGFEPALIRF